MESEQNISRPRSLTREECIEIIEKAGKGCQQIQMAIEQIDIHDLDISLLQFVA